MNPTHLHVKLWVWAAKRADADGTLALARGELARRFGTTGTIDDRSKNIHRAIQRCVQLGWLAPGSGNRHIVVLVQPDTTTTEEAAR